ncbi:DNA-binding protein [Pseudomonas sp. JQ170C]|uniref:DNA-binding protein n=1 Tax=unclassified Pseudomonas TaxID=196821 RepID=UPI00265A274C|nr:MULTISPECIES: DNA-binding protein [unclassified Pseudomonas]WRO74988.1 DNA-binding protein [Pseudomonas sp. 170C]
MARSGINKALVQGARDALLARGATPSIEAVRAELGDTGSKTTITRYLRELASEEPRPPAVTLTEEVQVYVESLVQRLAADAQEAVSADRARLERQKLAYEQQRQVDSARHDELKKSHQLLLDERHESREREHSLNTRVQQLEGERQRLLATESHLQRAVGDRAEQIQSLEEKYQQARESLAHYREHTRQQRDNDIHRHETQVQQLQHDQRRLQELVMSKQEELTLLYRDLERQNAENHAKDIALQAEQKRFQQLHANHAQLNTALSRLQQREQALQLEVSSLRERAHRYLLDRRQDRRNLRGLAQQLDQVHQLLARLPNTAVSFRKQPDADSPTR